MMMNLFLLSLGSSLGALTRYLLGVMLTRNVVSPLPLSMIIVNLLGSLGLGFFYRFFPTQTMEEPLFLLVAVGFFGAFTTFSTFSMEAVQLFRDKKWTALLVYVAATIGGSFAMFYVGYTI